ncbi:MAG: hypothetical protein JJE04_18945 [Acidobacteriia bacterium]|nr:hypothetical protein [Terriglobia bacterium]
MRNVLILFAGFHLLLYSGLAQTRLMVDGRPSVMLSGSAALMVIDLNGGSIVQFQLREQGLNPLRWANTGGAGEARPMSHFLCLDRWGQPSAAELKNGMPFHGEATRVRWEVVEAGAVSARMKAKLPMAGLEVERVARMEPGSAAVLVTETVTNGNPLGRLYNMVQHPTIGPPFLDESTLVDSNAGKGFMQSSPLPNPEEPSVQWPYALLDGKPVDMRRLQSDPMPNVVSYVVDEQYGWATAVHPARGLLIGYVWKSAEYPWFNAWRHVADGKPLARGLEFGTTGLHQPFPVLVEKGRIFGRTLYEYLDAAQRETRGYVMFLAQTPAGYTGVARVEVSNGELVIHGRDGGRIVVKAALLEDWKP